jgi:hypothetical protein
MADAQWFMVSGCCGEEAGGEAERFGLHETRSRGGYHFHCTLMGVGMVLRGFDKGIVSPFDAGGKLAIFFFDGLD